MKTKKKLRKSGAGFCNYCGEKLIQEDRHGGICGSCHDLDPDSKPKRPKRRDDPDDGTIDTDIPGQMWTDEFW